ncbi:MAG: hypothetical protein K1X39_02595 [Thermoflexales bacterium]|nr:hypothetical protein [Thermoflexales bacterium]
MTSLPKPARPLVIRALRLGPLMLLNLLLGLFVLWGSGVAQNLTLGAAEREIYPAGTSGFIVFNVILWMAGLLAEGALAVRAAEIDIDHWIGLGGALRHTAQRFGALILMRVLLLLPLALVAGLGVVVGAGVIGSGNAAAGGNLTPAAFLSLSTSVLCALAPLALLGLIVAALTGWLARYAQCEILFHGRTATSAISAAWATLRAHPATTLALGVVSFVLTLLVWYVVGRLDRDTLPGLPASGDAILVFWALGSAVMAFVVALWTLVWRHFHPANAQPGGPVDIPVTVG